MTLTTAQSWQERAVSLLLVLVAFGLPLFTWPWAVDSFVLAKWTFVGVAFALAALVLLWGMAQGEPARVGLTPGNALLAVFFLWSALSLLWASSFDVSAQDLWQLAMALGLAFCLKVMLLGRRDRLLIVVGAYQAATLVLAVWALAADALFAFAPDMIGVKRVLGDWRDALGTVSLGNSGHLADALALGFLGWIGTFILARRPWQRWLATAALVLHAAALIVAWSVHSNASLIVGSGLGWLLLSSRPKVFDWQRRWRGWAALGLGWFLVVAFFTLDHPANPHGSAVWAAGDESSKGGIFAQAFASDRWQEGWPTRLAIWMTSAEIVRENPWLGVGFGGLPYVYPSVRSELVTMDPHLSRWANSWTNAAHNDPLQTWAELGVVGLFLLFALIAASAFTAVKRMQNEPRTNAVILALVVAAMAAQLVQMQMSFPLQLPTSMVAFFVLLSLPEVLPARGAAAGGIFMVPVEYETGPVRLQVRLENMQTPREAGLSLADGIPAKGAIVGVAVLLFGWVAWESARPLRGDVAYRPAREAFLELSRMPGGATPSAWRGETAQRAEAAARAALAVWPNHVDCRSALSDLLVRQQLWAEALPEIERVARSLNAIEVPMRRALALDGLGRRDEALAHWSELFRRRPELQELFPDQAVRVARAASGAGS